MVSAVFPVAFLSVVVVREIYFVFHVFEKFPWQRREVRNNWRRRKLRASHVFDGLTMFILCLRRYMNVHDRLSQTYSLHLTVTVASDSLC